MPDAIPEKINDENSEEIDFSFLPDNEKVLWKSTGWVKYLEIIKLSCRTLLITNMIALSICVIVSVLVILFSAEHKWHLAWILPLIYGVVLLVASGSQGLFVAVGPFEFIPILRYKKTYSTNELNPYRWFKILTTENIIFKEVENPKTKWSIYQKQYFKFEHDRITCPIEHIMQIIIRPDFLGYYNFRIYGKLDEPDEDIPSKENCLLKWKLSAKEISGILPNLFTMEREGKIKLKILGADERVSYGSLLVFVVVCSIISAIVSLG